MATKNKLETQIKNLKVKNKSLKESNDLLVKQQKELKAYAEEQGSECAKVRHELLRLQEVVGK